MAREFARRFYKSKAWKDCRNYIVKKYHGICQECGAAGEEVHHKEFLNAININDPSVTLNEDNLVLLCRDCHFKKHRETNPLEKSFFHNKVVDTNGMYFDENGDLIPIQKYIIYGSPGAGKTTYVKHHKGEGDLVVDLDLIMQAISMESKSRTPDTLLSVALSIRDTIYKMIENNKVRAKTIWIVATLPYKKEREQLAKRLDAQLIFINKDIEECMANAINDSERTDKHKQRQLIMKWFESYEC